MSTALGLLSFQKAIKGGVRPNLFQVNHGFPTGVTPPAISEVQGGEVPYMCKAAALPATNVGTVELPFRGRVIKVPGDRTYETWTATFYMDDAFELRSAYDRWIQLTNGVDTNTAEADVTTGGILEDITVEQLNKFGGTSTELEVIRTYKLFAGFPVSVSQVSVAYDNNDSYEEFDVEFAYQYHTAQGGENKNNVVES